MKIIFFGTPLFSAEILRYLVKKGIEVSAVITQPDKTQGRNLKLVESPVKKVARELLPDVPLCQPLKISDPSFLEFIRPFQADLYVVVAFGQIFPKVLLDMPPLGCINVHTSLLPKYRGAAPIQRCIINGDKETGSTIMYMVEKLDAGDILASKRLPITPEMNAGDLAIALCELSKPLLHETILQLGEGGVKPMPQDPSAVTFAKKVTPEDAWVQWDKTAEEHFNQIRGVNPKPGAWCFVVIRGKKLRLKLIDVKPADLSGTSGDLLEYDPKNGIIIACKDKSLSLQTVQLEGKKPLDAQSFIRGCSKSDIFFPLT